MLKPSLLTGFMLCLGLFLQAQYFHDTIYYNQTGQATDFPDSAVQYRILTNDTTGLFQFVVNDYSVDGKLMMNGSFRSLNPDNKNGLFTWYYPNGQLKKQCSFINNKLEGQYRVWHENGILRQLSYYKNNLLHGESNTWNSAGVLTKYVEYENGKKNGKFLTYYSNGNPIRRETYKNDVFIKGQCFTATGSDTAYFRYFTPPSFKGGDISFFAGWVLEKLQYPDEARNKREEGEVKVKFIIDTGGKLTKPVITKHDKSYFNREVLRAITDSPIWSPALRDTDTVEVTIEIPIKFELPK